MGPMHEKVRGWIQAVAKRTPKAVDPIPAAAHGEVRHPVAPPPSASAPSSIRVRIDPEAWRATAPPLSPRHDSGSHHLSAIGARSEIHSGWEGPFEALNPFDEKDKS